MSIIFNSNDPQIACDVYALVKREMPEANPFLVIGGGNAGLDVRDEHVEAVKAFLAERERRTLEERERECMEEIHGSPDAEMCS